jgi:hypothetical protein
VNAGGEEDEVNVGGEDVLKITLALAWTVTTASLALKITLALASLARGGCCSGVSARPRRTTTSRSRTSPGAGRTAWPSARCCTASRRSRRSVGAFYEAQHTEMPAAKARVADLQVSLFTLRQ